MTPTVHHYLNGKYYSSLMDYTNPSLGISNERVKVINGNLTCSFTRENVYPYEGYYNITYNNYPYVLVAYGIGKFRLSNL
jgi:hypothetical protein